jgi:Delta3,5-Delta2,4-dienoyl-CoA isomerase
MSKTHSPHPLDKDFEFLSLSLLQPKVVVVALDRPEKRNAMNRKMWKEIGHAFSCLGRLGDGCRCILLVGHGASFSAGIDMFDSSFLPEQGGLMSVDVAHVGLAFQPKLKEMQDCFTALEECPVPVVAAIHGYCIGAAIDLVCAADVRICTQDTFFSVREVALGLAADVGTLQRLPKIVGNQSLVREICLTGRNVSALEAFNMGLVSKVVVCADQSSLLQSATEICSEIAKHSPVAVHGTKKALLYARDHSVRDGLEQIASFNSMALQSPDVTAAWNAGAAKEDPSFRDLPAQSRL